MSLIFFLHSLDAQELRDEFDIDVRVLGIMSSSRMLLSDTALDLSTWRDQFQE